MKILEAKIEFEQDGKINRIVVLADFTSNGKPLSDVRAITGDCKERWGYQQITKDDKLSQGLIEKVGRAGQEVQANEEFPGWKKKYK